MGLLVDESIPLIAWLEFATEASPPPKHHRNNPYVALATLAAATGAFAQSPNARAITGSNVEIFGVFDAAVTKFTQDGGGSVLRMQGEGRNESSRLGFRGVEDMGGGWGAGFWLEAGMFVETGAGQNTTNNNTSAGQSGLSNGTSNATAVPDLPSIGAMQGLTFNRASVMTQQFLLRSSC